MRGDLVGSVSVLHVADHAVTAGPAVPAPQPAASDTAATSKAVTQEALVRLAARAVASPPGNLPTLPILPCFALPLPSKAFPTQCHQPCARDQLLFLHKPSVPSEVLRVTLCCSVYTAAVLMFVQVPYKGRPLICQQIQAPSQAPPRLSLIQRQLRVGRTRCKEEEGSQSGNVSRHGRLNQDWQPDCQCWHCC